MDDKQSNVIVLDENHSPEKVDELKTALDAPNETFSLTVRDGDSKELTVLVNSIWLDSLLLEPALADAKYEMETYEGASWYSIWIPKPDIGQTLVFEGFKPKVDKAVYSRGSLQSVRLERPMFVSLTEVPRLETESVTMSNSNGTWVEEVPKPVNRFPNFNLTFSLNQSKFKNAPPLCPGGQKKKWYRTLNSLMSLTILKAFTISLFVIFFPSLSSD